jgi:hypothetical protein
MAKSIEENRQQQSGAAGSSGAQASSNRDGNGEFQQATRDARDAARHAQAGAAEFVVGAMEPLAELAQHVEGATRQWADGMRTSVEQTVSVASKMNETVLNEARRASEFYLGLWETSASLQRSFMGEGMARTRREMQQQRSSGYRSAAE